MKQHKAALSTAVVTAVAVLGMLGAGNLGAQQTAYSAGSLTGDYALTEQGTIGLNSTVVAIGRYTFDGNGGVTGWQTVQSASVNLTTTCTGTYTIDADGSGTMTIVHTMQVLVPEGEESPTTTVTYRFLAQGAGSAGLELRAIRSANGEVVASTLTRAQSGITAESLKGAYILSESGAIGGASTPLAGLGAITFDGAGGVTGWEATQVANRSLVTAFTGAYAIGADGVGTMRLVHSLPATGIEEEAATQTAEYKFLVVNDNGTRQLRAVRSDNGMAVSSTFRAR